MANEFIELNLIPTGDKPVFHAAQYDVGRPIIIHLKNGEDDFTPTDLDLELQVRKVDNNIVTAVPDSVLGNVVTFLSTQQMTACSGTNLCEVQLSDNEHTIATLHFFLVVQRDVLNGGISSASEIHDLTEQIAEIVPEVIGDDYYNKTEVDDLIAEHTFDPTNYYDKSDVNTLLNAKVNTSDLSPVAFSGDYNDLENKPDIPDMSDYYTKSEVDTKITGLTQIKTASGSFVHITDGGNDIPVKSFKSDIVAAETGSGEKSPTNPYTVSGFSNGIVSVNSNTYTFPFGQTVYGGYFNNKGVLVDTHNTVDLSSLAWTYQSAAQRFVSTGISSTVKAPATNNDVAKITSSILQTTFANNTSVGGLDNSIGITTTGNIVIKCTSAGTSPSDLVTLLSGTFFAYEVDSPTTISITEEKILTVKVCDISSDTGDIEVEYFTSKSDGIAELIKAFM